MRHDDLIRHVFPMLGDPTSVESLADGSYLLVAGEPGEVVVRIGRVTVQVMEYGVTWHEPHVPTFTPRLLASVRWRKIVMHRLQSVLSELITAARENRRKTFMKCRICGEVCGPESRHDDVCHGCAERHLGIVH